MLEQMAYQRTTMPPPVNVPNFAPTDIWYMQYHGNVLRQEAQRTSMMADPMMRQLENTLEDTKYSNLVNQLRDSGYTGSALQQQLLSHQATQILMGGNIPAGASRLMTSAGYATSGGGPIANMTELANRHQSALALTAGMNRAYMNQIYNTDTMAPDPVQLMGFRAEARMNIAAQMMRRGHIMGPGDPTGQFIRGEDFTVEDGQYVFTKSGREKAGLAAYRVEPVMNMLASGRLLFGEQSASQMLASTERFFGVNATGMTEVQDEIGNIVRDPATGKPQMESRSVYLRHRMREIAALARSVGMDARELVNVKNLIQTQMEALGGTSGLNKDIYGRADTGGLLEARAGAMAQSYAHTVGYLQNQGVVMNQQQKERLQAGFAELNQITSKSTLGRGTRIVSGLVAAGQVSEGAQSQYEAAVARGDRFAVQQAMRRISEEQFGDPNVLMKTIQSETASNYYEQVINENLTDRERDAAARKAEDTMSRMVYMEGQDRKKRAQLGQISGAAIRRARGAGVRLDLRAADRAGVESMIAAVRNDEILTGVSEQDREAMVRQLEQWQESGMSSSEIQRRMRGSALFQAAGVDPRQLQLSAAKGRTRSLADQLESNEANIVRGEQAKYLFGIDPKSQAARDARRQYQRLMRAGKTEEAQAVLDKYTDSLDPKVQGDVRRINKRIAENVKESRKRLTETNKEGEYKLAVDPTMRAQLGTQRAQMAAEARAKAMEEDVDPAIIKAQLAEGDKVEKMVREQEVGGVGAMRDFIDAAPAKRGFFERWKAARGEQSLLARINPLTAGVSDIMAFGKAFMGDDEKAQNEATLERDREGPIEVVIVENRSYRGAPRGTGRTKGSPRRGG
jgi:hypothetical protein